MRESYTNTRGRKKGDPRLKEMKGRPRSNRPLPFPKIHFTNISAEMVEREFDEVSEREILNLTKGGY